MYHARIRLKVTLSFKFVFFRIHLHRLLHRQVMQSRRRAANMFGMGNNLMREQH
jgi:hypothetical protein